MRIALFPIATDLRSEAISVASSQEEDLKLAKVGVGIEHRVPPRAYDDVCS